MFGRLAAEQRAPGLDATIGDSLDQLCDDLGHNLADGDVVLEEQRFGTADDEVVDHHRHEIAAEGVVLAHGLCHGDLCSHTVGGRRENRLAVAALELEQAGKASESTHDLGTQRALRVRGEQLHCSLTGIDVHSRRSI